MIVVGIDLSLTSTGLTRIHGREIAALGNVRTKGKKADTLEQRSDRLSGILGEVLRFAWDAGMPDLVVIEAPSYGSTGGAAHDRSGLWWSVVGSLREGDIPVASVSPQGRAKYGTGSGRSKKDEVLAAVRAEYQILTPQTIANDDIADSILLAAMGARELGYPIEPVMPSDKRLEALAGVSWPSSMDAWR